MKLSDFSAYGEKLEKWLRLKTYPLAVKLLEKEGDIPEGATRPKRDLGYHLTLCQAFSMSRRQGMLMAMLKEDMWCYLPVLALGIAEPPEAFFEGDGFISYLENRKAAKNLARAFPRLKAGKYIGVMSAPLTTANFEPDLVIIYCNSAQMNRLLLARGWPEGYEVSCTMSFGTGCVFATVPSILSGECKVAMPCPGDRKYALAEDDELVFAIPGGRLAGLMPGFRYLEESGQGFPTQLTLICEPSLPPGYGEMGRLMGMEVKGE